MRSVKKDIETEDTVAAVPGDKDPAVRCGTNTTLVPYITSVAGLAKMLGLHTISKSMAVLIWFLAVLVYGCFRLWLFWSWPFWSMDVLDLPRNSLPNDVVHAEFTNIFKTRLDKFWNNQDIFMITMPKFKDSVAEVYLTSN